MHADNWAIKAKQDGYRTRAVYKLDEIVQKTKVLKKAKHILDLGSAPGGWAHYIKQKSKLILVLLLGGGLIILNKNLKYLMSML